MEVEQLLNTVMRVGTMLMSSGAEVYRVEDTMNRAKLCDGNRNHAFDQRGRQDTHSHCQGAESKRECRYDRSDQSAFENVCPPAFEHGAHRRRARSDR